MQTLLLATSLILSGTTEIAKFETAEELKAQLDLEVQKVTETILYNTAVSVQDNFLFQAKWALRTAKVEDNTKTTYILAAK